MHARHALPWRSKPVNARAHSSARPAHAAHQLRRWRPNAVAFQKDGLQQLPTLPIATPLDVANPASTDLIRTPDQFTLQPGELSQVDRTSEGSLSDVYRCPGCTLPECQGATGCAATPWRFSLDGYLREILTARVYDVAVISPLEEARRLSIQIGNTVLLKREDLQPVFSFKLRGAYNKMVKLSPEQLARGVITSSAGNHAQGVALSAKKLGCKATICMPLNTPEIKVNSVRQLGGTVELVGETYQEAQAHAFKRAGMEKLCFVAPYDDPYTIAGQGTIGDEILRQIHDPQRLDVIFVAIGGGGLIAGIAAYVKVLHPHVKVIGVEPTGANAMAMSLARGQRITLSKVDSFADGVAVKQVGQETFRLCRELVDGVVLVDNAAISAAIKDVFNETRNILEPAGAVAVAGAKAWLKFHKHKNKTVVAVTSGANMNFERLRLVSELAEIGSMTEAMLVTTIPELPGAFKVFVDTATQGISKGLYVTEFKYRFSAGESAQILWSMAFKEQEELETVLVQLNKVNMQTRDISTSSAAQIHLRHLVGGRARAYTGQIPHEKIFQIQFPERKGALRTFLDVVSPRWNITLFHYRNTGNRESYVLLGVQVPPYDEEQFLAASETLTSGDFTFTELSSEDREVFDLFIQ